MRKNINSSRIVCSRKRIEDTNLHRFILKCLKNIRAHKYILCYCSFLAKDTSLEVLNSCRSNTRAYY